MDGLWLILIGSSVGGFVAGSIALLLGGVGGQLKLQKMLLLMADEIVQVNARVEREIKRRNVDQRHDRGGAGDPMVAELEKIANSGGGGARPATPADVMAEARRRGMVR